MPREKLEALSILLHELQDNLQRRDLPRRRIRRRSEASPAARERLQGGTLTPNAVAVASVQPDIYEYGSTTVRPRSESHRCRAGVRAHRARRWLSFGCCRPVRGLGSTGRNERGVGRLRALPAIDGEVQSVSVTSARAVGRLGGRRLGKSWPALPSSRASTFAPPRSLRLSCFSASRSG